MKHRQRLIDQANSTLNRMRTIWMASKGLEDSVEREALSHSSEEALVAMEDLIRALHRIPADEVEPLSTACKKRIREIVAAGSQQFDRPLMKAKGTTDTRT